MPPLQRSESPPPPDPILGSTLLHYRVLDEIGRGGRGRVYLAEDLRLERRVALKVLANPLVEDAAVLAELEREAHTLAAVNHPNIATIYSLENEGDLHFITMELVSGETLATRLRKGALPLDRAYDVVRQIASAMEAAHARGIAHHDLKPTNIHLTPDGQVKVLDFGLAELFGEERVGEDSTVRTRDTVFAGTPGYMSPEQLRGQPTESRTDVWALGCVFYECLTGRPAFGGATFSDRVAATLEREPDWGAVPDVVSERIRALLVRCLAKEVSERPGTMSEIRSELEEEITRRRLGTDAEESSRQAPRARAVHVPRPLDAFVGRAREITAISRALRETPLVTLTGPAGCGKTRLAIQAAHELAGSFADGVWFVELAPTHDPDLVLQTVATALGVTEEPHQPLAVTLRARVRDKRVLIVLDNCEHVLGASGRLIEDLVRSNPQLSVLATSREVLHLPGERVLPVPSLALPLEGQVGPRAIGGVEAIELFADRVRSANPEFELTEDSAPVVAKICARLDGIPLALELAAARVRSLSLTELAERLDECFCFLTGGVPTSLPKHQTLRASIDWSYDLLTSEEQRLFRSLSVFAGGWTLAAAERVGVSDGLGAWQILDLHCHLVEKSLVEVVTNAPRPGQRSRYRMLEIMRQYAGARLSERREEETVRARHLAHYLEMAETAEPHLRDARQTDWIPRLDRERENLRVAFRTADQADDPELGLRLAGALGRYWMVRGHWDEGRNHCRRVLSRVGNRPRTLAQGRTLNASGNLAFHQGHYDQARRDHLAALAIRREVGDAEGEANSLNNLGEVARIQGDFEHARESYEASREIQERIGDRWGMAVSLNNLGEVAQTLGDLELAEELHESSLALWREIRDRWGAAWSLGNLGYVAVRRGDLVGARDYYERSLAKSRELQDQFGIALSLHALGGVAFRQGDLERARAHHVESLSIRRGLGDRKGIAESLEAIALLEGEPGERALLLLAAAEAVRERIRAPVSERRHLELAREIARLRSEIGEEAFGTAWLAGHGFSADEAAARALEIPSTLPQRHESPASR